MVELEGLLKENSDHRTKLIVSDGVFSMDGSVTPLRLLIASLLFTNSLCNVSCIPFQMTCFQQKINTVIVSRN